MYRPRSIGSAGRLCACTAWLGALSLALACPPLVSLRVSLALPDPVGWHFLLVRCVVLGVESGFGLSTPGASSGEFGVAGPRCAQRSLGKLVVACPPLCCHVLQLTSTDTGVEPGSRLSALRPAMEVVFRIGFCQPGCCLKLHGAWHLAFACPPCRSKFWTLVSFCAAHDHILVILS